MYVATLSGFEIRRQLMPTFYKTTRIAVAILCVGCSQASDGPDQIEVPKATEIPIDFSPIDIDGSVTGSMTMVVSREELTFDFKHIVAYRFEYQLAGPPSQVSTWVLLTPTPIDKTDVASQLERNQADLMEARPLFPNGPYLTMEISDDGMLRQVSGNVQGDGPTWAGGAVAAYGVKQNVRIADGRVKGEIELTKANDYGFSFHCAIDVRHFSE
jgi:hypothetical protein